MNLTDAGCGYSELATPRIAACQTIITTIETEWILRHGAPLSISADDEFNRKPLRTYLAAHDIGFRSHPARRYNKVGIVERKNGTIKRILAKLEDESSDASAETIIARAVFLSNVFSGNRTLSSFELVRGYSPSILGLSTTAVTSELLQAHKEQIATRTMQKLINSRAPDVIRKEMCSEGDPVWIYYQSTKQKENTEWLRGTVVKAEEHYIMVRKSARGAPMRIAYADVRIAPHSELTCELLQRSLEEELSGDTVDTGTEPCTRKTAQPKLQK